jgi:hypothetical protein
LNDFAHSIGSDGDVIYPELADMFGIGAAADAGVIARRSLDTFR